MSAGDEGPRDLYYKPRGSDYRYMPSRYVDRRTLFVERLPSFDILKARANWRRGRPALLWTDERFRYIGSLQIQNFSDDSVVAPYHFRESLSMRAADGHLHVRLVWQKRDDIHPRPQALCPLCRSRCEKLYIVQSIWGCRKCHGIKYLSQRMTPLQRNYMLLDTIGQALAERDKLSLADQQVLISKHCRLFEKTQRFERPRVAPELLRRVNGRWMTVKELREAEAARLRSTADEIAVSIKEDDDD